MSQKKWFSATEYVDVETGELITKSKYEREYYKTGKSATTITENEKYRIKSIRFECRPNKQGKLF